MKPNIQIYGIFVSLFFTSTYFAYDRITIAHNENKVIRRGIHNTVITILGTGYVGLVTGAGLAEFGNTIICADIDEEKIQLLQRGGMPIFEPGLKELVERNTKSERLTFTADVQNAIRVADIIFIAVNTPTSQDGSADLSVFYRALALIATNMNKYKLIITKSTVPVGTGDLIREFFQQEYGVDSQLFDIASNPEFLREGTAVHDFLQPDRLVIGIESEHVLEVLCAIYAPLVEHGVPHVLTSIVSAEMIKYAANAFLATKLSYINEIANLCDEVGADISTIASAMGLDKRISPLFLKPGPGFGGSCFPKDTQALLYTAKQHDVALHTVRAAVRTNNAQQRKPVEKLERLFYTVFGSRDMSDKVVAVLGLAFKANTDDVRYSPAITVIKMLLERGALVTVYDPAAMNNMSMLLPQVMYCKCLYDAVAQADGVIIMTEWDEFRAMDLEVVGMLMNHRILVDARGIIPIDALYRYDFIHDNIGQSYLCRQSKKIIGA
ncbi:MAG TPA: UDP-glucose/GDP-mannose dehydrogenase family protein [Candidatus Bathyarchaeia archaeon]|nr:UDP-glucose/GDP-mannose dehydrogenase family protein [Candidatus Bathyarchaeia archaeon]